MRRLLLLFLPVLAIAQVDRFPVRVRLEVDSIKSYTPSSNIVIMDSVFLRGALGMGQASTIRGWQRWFNTAGASYVDLYAPATNLSGTLTLPGLTGDIAVMTTGNLGNFGMSGDLSVTGSGTFGSVVKLDSSVQVKNIAGTGYLDFARRHTHPLESNIMYSLSRIDTINTGDTTGLIVNGFGSGSIFVMETGATPYGGAYTFAKRGRTGDANGAILDSTELGYISFTGWDTTAYGRGAYILGRAIGDYSSSNHGGQIEFWVVPEGSTVQRLSHRIEGDGTITFFYALNGNIQFTGNVQIDGTTTLDSIIAATVNLSGDARINGGDLVMNATTNQINPATSDGSDNKRILLFGGGAASTSRGGAVGVLGNEYASADSGVILLQPGSTANGQRTKSLGDIVPYTTGAWDLGQSSLEWDSLYVGDVRFSSGLFPSTTGKDIGTSSVPVDTLYTEDASVSGFANFTGTNYGSATFGAGDSIQITLTGFTSSGVVIPTYTSNTAMTTSEIPLAVGNKQTNKFTIFGSNGETCDYWVVRK